MQLVQTNLEILKSFVSFVESPNIVTAADNLKISQPLMTKHLQTLQNNERYPVFQFKGRKKVLTKYGKDLYLVVKNSLNELENKLTSLELQQSDAAQAVLRFGGRDELIERLFLKNKFPGRISFFPMSGQDVTEAIKSQKLDLGISQYKLKTFDVIERPLLKSRMCLVWPSKYGLESLAIEKILAQLIELPYFSYGHLDQILKLLAVYKVKKELKIKRVIPRWSAIWELCISNDGWSLIPDSYIRENRAVSAIEIPVKVLPATEFSLFYQRDLAKLPWFIDFIRELVNSQRE